MCGTERTVLLARGTRALSAVMIGRTSRQEPSDSASSAAGFWGVAAERQSSLGLVETL